MMTLSSWKKSEQNAGNGPSKSYREKKKYSDRLPRLISAQCVPLPKARPKAGFMRNFRFFIVWFLHIDHAPQGLLLEHSDSGHMDHFMHILSLGPKADTQVVAYWQLRHSSIRK